MKEFLKFDKVTAKVWGLGFLEHGVDDAKLYSDEVV